MIFFPFTVNWFSVPTIVDFFARCGALVSPFRITKVEDKLLPNKNKVSLRCGRYPGKAIFRQQEKRENRVPYMENHPLSVWNSTFENDDFLFEPPTCQSPPSVHHWINADDSHHLSYQWDQSTLPDSYLPFMDPHETLLIEPAPLSIQDYGFCDVPSALSEGDPSTKAVVSSSNNGEGAVEAKENIKGKQRRKRGSGKAGTLTKEKISEYFYLPITQAAKELHVSLTKLKIRCRELGIQRWPRRKLKSLQNLIKDVQERGEECENDDKIKAAVEGLEKEKKMVEEMPDLELDDNTRRLRRACSKANYKKRKLAAMQKAQEITPEAEPEDWDAAELLMTFTSMLT